MLNRKAENTNKATKQWIACLSDFLKERKLPKVDEIADAELPQILGEFYFSLRKKRVKPKGKEKLSRSQLNKQKHYKNSSLKSGRAALNRYFKEKRCIDIISNERVTNANEQFKAVTKLRKTEGRGEIESKEPISDEDMKKLFEFFRLNMTGPLDAKSLQDIVLFNIIYFSGRRRRENLRTMTKDTFEIKTDVDGRKYIKQKIKEMDKNHKENDYTNNNEARIYKQRGAFSLFANSVINSDILRPPILKRFHSKCFIIFYF